MVYFLRKKLGIGIPSLITNYFCGNKSVFAVLNAHQRTSSTISVVCLAYNPQNQPSAIVPTKGGNIMNTLNNGRDYNGWDELFHSEFSKTYFVNLKQFLLQEYATKHIYPPKRLILNAFDQTAYEDVNVVILGQDPYYNPGQAMGMSFSVQPGISVPMSLYNIFKEIESDLGYKTAIVGGDLTQWARQGVLLLNAVLTVEEGKPNSHKGKGWEQFTDAVISYLNKRERGMVFLLWGRNAQEKRALITGKQHLVLTAAHPSPLSATHGFFGCGHFSKANEFLAEQNRQIRW